MQTEQPCVQLLFFYKWPHPDFPKLQEVIPPKHRGINGTKFRPWFQWNQVYQKVPGAQEKFLQLTTRLCQQHGNPHVACVGLERRLCMSSEINATQDIIP